ncbi:MAG: DUF58 domain-containing protein [Streptosporangiaceae bacterium]|jgi:uncharacterized protein (DUF58 family)
MTTAMTIGHSEARTAVVTPGQPHQVELSWGPTRHARRLLTLALAGLTIAVLTRRAEFAATAAPALLLLAAWRQDRPRRILVSATLTARRMIEGEYAAVQVTVSGYGALAVELRIDPASAITPGPPGSAAASGPSDDGPADDGPDRDAQPSLPFLATRWGRRQVGVLEITLRDRWRISEGRAAVPLPWIDCYPQPARQRSRVVLSRLPSRLGEHAARVPGEGSEFAGVRGFIPGDRQRRINWPATTRRGSLQLNTFAAERVQNVVVLADGTADVGSPGSTTSDLVHRGAAGTVRAYLAARDRVGFIAYRSQVSWITPGTGQRQFHRVMDAMLADPGSWNVRSGIRRLPRAALPPGALIIVFSPLLDNRLVETLRDLRGRGFTLLIVDVLNADPGGGKDRFAELARRIWRMEQDAIRFSLRELGIPVVHWDGEQSLDEPLAPYTRRVMVSRR